MSDNENTDDLFGDVIYSYTRREAVVDGEQIDLTGHEMLKQAGILFPVYVTRKVWNECVEVPSNKPTQDLDGRLWDVLWMTRNATSRSQGDEVDVTLSVVTAKGRRNMKLLAQCGATDIDNADPAITIMFPEER